MNNEVEGSQSRESSVGGLQASAAVMAALRNPSTSLPPQLPVHIRIPSADQSQTADTTLAVSVGQTLMASRTKLEPSSKSKTYGAPRVFDLFTLLAITLAFAVLFALLGLLAPAVDASASSLTVAMGLFVALVGVSQMWLFGSNNPRVASLISGPFAFALVVWFPLSRATDSLFEGLCASLCFGLFFGPVAGYLAGAVVAGVFLLADKFRTTTSPTGGNHKDASFDELE